MKSMAQLEYHYGLKMRCYPSDQQKQIIKVNSDASRFIYNEMVAIGKELWQLSRVRLPIDTVQDRIQQLKLRRNARQMSNHFQFLEDISKVQITIFYIHGLMIFIEQLQ